MIIIRKLATLIVILFGIIIFLISPIGLNTTLFLASHFIPGQFTYQRVSGNLTKSLTLVNFKYESDALHITGKYFKFSWQPKQLLHRKLVIRNITAHDININITESQAKKTLDAHKKKNTIELAPPPTHFSALHLSWALIIKQCSLSHITFQNSRLDHRFNLESVEVFGQLDADNTNLELHIGNPEDQGNINAVLKGNLQHYTLEADYKNIFKKQYYMLNAAGNQTHLNVKIKTQSNQENTLQLESMLTLRWHQKLSWQGYVQVKNLPLTMTQLSPLHQANFYLSAQGEFDGGAINQRIDIANLRLKFINGTHVNGHTVFTQHNKLIHLDGTLKNQADYFDLHAVFNEFMQINWRLSVSELSDYFMTLNGELSSEGSIKKENNRSLIDAKTTVSGMSLGALNIDTVDLIVNGSFRKHHIQLSGSAAQAKFFTHITAHLKETPLKWEADLDQFNLDSKLLGEYKLREPTEILFSADKIIVKNFQLLSENGSLLLKFIWSSLKQTLNGILKLQINKISLPTINIILTALHVDGTASGHAAKLSMNVMSQQSALDLTASANWRKALNIQAKLKGDDVLVMNTSAYRVEASPNFTLSVDKTHRIDLNGELLIPQAKITPDRFISVVTLPTDLEFVGVTQDQPSLWKFYSKINVLLGDSITLNTHGIQGRLNGKLTLVKEPKQTFLGDGQLSLTDSLYTILGQTLTIKKGLLSFTSSTLSNPNLDIQASRTLSTSLSTSTLGIRSLEVGANVNGTLKKPEISFSRSPSRCPISIFCHIYSLEAVQVMLAAADQHLTPSYCFKLSTILNPEKTQTTVI
jgi:autotransporter translocation and assembly factor TamB